MGWSPPQPLEFIAQDISGGYELEIVIIIIMIVLVIETMVQLNHNPLKCASLENH